MTSNVLIIIAQGSEELETVTCQNLLLRAGFKVTTASADSEGAVQLRGARGLPMTADCPLVTVADNEYDCIVLPGGLPGADHLAASPLVQAILNQQYCDEKWVAAICASPALVIQPLDCFREAYKTSYPSTANLIPAHLYKTKRVMVDKNHRLITSQGPGTTMEFALEIIARLAGIEKAAAVAEPMCVLPNMTYSPQFMNDGKAAQLS
ncbi:Protein/nucleic acid deglycase 3 [Vibrio stylophorae]|uniref:Protein/nucleic acid deglycase 3 n=1 Tax=Vibrio stylophorae TaxID=659351 RepID=A0ABN8DT30_9VIBR|nr:DJ-1 family glyoxalase III [Vibrio stylophorae]CAH0532945.1 Protein/nucleic acid deglycase 3 [Vibrio stylophorae]